MKSLHVLIILILCSPFVAAAQSTSDTASTQKLVHELKELTNQAERDRSANYRLIDQLRDLIARFDQPWSRRVLFDNFSDGDFIRNPVWHSNSDDFWVTRSIGLRTELNARPANNTAPERNTSPEAALLGMLLGGTMQQQQQPRADSNRNRANTRADLSTAVNISNAFSINIEISATGRGSSNGSFEFGPYQGQNIESGYRLVYQAGARPALKLIRYQRGTSAVIDVYESGRLLSDGNKHLLNWQRTANGTMRVSLDGRSIIQVRDRSYRDAFSGFVMSNRGGDYAIRSVSIHSAGR